MKFPVLESDRLVLRQLTIKDAQELFAYLSNDQVTQFYDIENLNHIQEAETIIKYWDEKFHTLEVIRWGITLKNDDRIIGTCGFHKWIKHHHKAEIGCELSPDHWKNGYMTEALSLIIDYGFKSLELNRMEALHHSENKNTRKILDKLQFQKEGTLHEFFYKNEKYINVVIHSLLKKNWNDQN